MAGPGCGHGRLAGSRGSPLAGRSGRCAPGGRDPVRTRWCRGGGAGSCGGRRRFGVRSLSVRFLGAQRRGGRRDGVGRVRWFRVGCGRFPGRRARLGHHPPRRRRTGPGCAGERARSARWARDGGWPRARCTPGRVAAAPVRRRGRRDAVRCAARGRAFRRDHRLPGRRPAWLVRPVVRRRHRDAGRGRGRRPQRAIRRVLPADARAGGPRAGARGGRDRIARGLGLPAGRSRSLRRLPPPAGRGGADRPRGWRPAGGRPRHGAGDFGARDRCHRVGEPGRLRHAARAVAAHAGRGGRRACRGNRADQRAGLGAARVRGRFAPEHRQQYRAGARPLRVRPERGHGRGGAQRRARGVSIHHRRRRRRRRDAGDAGGADRRARHGLPGAHRRRRPHAAVGPGRAGRRDDQDRQQRARRGAIPVRLGAAGRRDRGRTLRAARRRRPRHGSRLLDRRRALARRLAAGPGRKMDQHLGARLRRARGSVPSKRFRQSAPCLHRRDGDARDHAGVSLQRYVVRKRERGRRPVPRPALLGRPEPALVYQRRIQRKQRSRHLARAQLRPDRGRGRQPAVAARRHGSRRSRLGPAARRGHQSPATARRRFAAVGAGAERPMDQHIGTRLRALQRRLLAQPPPQPATRLRPGHERGIDHTHLSLRRRLVRKHRRSRRPLPRAAVLGRPEPALVPER